MATSDPVEGIRAFLEKRAPQFARSPIMTTGMKGIK
jgi:1,4-dihydroxy-2-naphthoyl-CoA synthase